MTLKGKGRAYIDGKHSESVSISADEIRLLPSYASASCTIPLSEEEALRFQDAFAEDILDVNYLDE